MTIGEMSYHCVVMIHKRLHMNIKILVEFRYNAEKKEIKG
jgi:hypothetical protein